MYWQSLHYERKMIEWTDRPSDNQRLRDLDIDEISISNDMFAIIYLILI